MIQKKGKSFSTLFRLFVRRLRLVWRNSQESAPRLELAWIVAGMFLKEAVQPFLPEWLRTQAKFLGYQVRFPSYSLFCFLFEAIFLRCDYVFACNAATPIIIDCGGNIGVSILWFKRRYPDAFITAFEPEPYTFEYLSRNVIENGLEHVVLHQAAVAGKEGHFPFFVEQNQQAALGMSLTKRLQERGKESGKITVPCVRLSRFIKQPVDILKLDVEGAESQVLSDLYDENKLQLISELFLEYHYDESNPENRLSQILEILEETGFAMIVDASLPPPYPKRCHKPYKVNVYAYRHQDSPACC